MYKRQHVHFVGIGGIGMSGIAQVLLDLGNKVSGSDLHAGANTMKISQKGGRIFIGHHRDNLGDADVVVISSAISQDNPEVREARKRGIPVIARAEMLSELMRLKKYGIAVAGAHGKTSTTSLTASVLASLDPTMVIGGMVKGLESNAYWGKGDFLVAEADESDGSFLRLCPTICVVTNIDREHLDYYSDIGEIKEAFMAFIEKIPFYGVAVLCADDPHLEAMIPTVRKRVITYGTSEKADLQARRISVEGTAASYMAYLGNRPLGPVRLSVPGLHHVRNSLAAMAVGLELGIDMERIRDGLAHYGGVGRRFEIKGEEAGITVLDDYAHHPTEICATLAAARQAWPKRRLVVLFEPHRYSRTRALMDEFAQAFDEADQLWITDIYPASESPIVGVSGATLARKIQNRLKGRVFYHSDRESLPSVVTPVLRPSDVVITMGAGRIGYCGPVILDMLRGGKAAGAY